MKAFREPVERSALEFQATVNDQGLISDFTVMVRPMPGATALMEAMAAQERS